MKNLIEDYYNGYCEDNRLSKDNAHKVEFLTSLKYIEKVVPKGGKILDACAGTGVYSFILAEKGYHVVAGDLLKSHVDVIRVHHQTNPILDDIKVIDVTDLSEFENASFDAVLCMGALYHLHSALERKKALSECLRVLKPGGILVAAYINRHAQVLKELLKYGLDNLDVALDVSQKGFSDKSSEEQIFYKSTPEEFENEILGFGLKKLYNLATDGASFLLSERVNEMGEDEFEKWLGYHYSTCEDKNLLGYSMHGLYIGQKI